ncbi:MAG: tRNA 2-thiouridine(34) synthase MnmA [Candidatus Schekmanbacteria bacterium]|nr:tRNA 2-thiouridine(34) synthase MnmA [Candidatus Schekmanbacteria bacterium]
MCASNHKTVIVAMSGGVDSSVAAFLLKEQGYNVIGISLQLYDQSSYSETLFGSCCSLKDIHDARRVAEKLAIPFYVINLEKEFREEVIDNFLSRYSNGKTPNPCILCNQKIKFRHLLNRAFGIGADFLATGHYASIEKDSASGEFILKKGIDANKDQSYFLAGMTQAQMQNILFPVGSLKKIEVREIARENGLPVWEKKESQEICFVPSNNYRDFLKREIPSFRETPGEIMTSDGTVVGKHNGIENFTIGQRKGIGLAFGKPFYVTALIPEKKQVVIGDENELFKTGMKVTGIIWHSERAVPASGMRLEVKYRYRSKYAAAEIIAIDGENATVKFLEPQKAITPGQAAVFYNDDSVLGGGWIEESQ